MPVIVVLESEHTMNLSLVTCLVYQICIVVHNELLSSVKILLSAAIMLLVSYYTDWSLNESSVQLAHKR